MSLLRLLVLALAMLLVAPHSAPADDKAALESFKTEINAIQAYIRDIQASRKANPAINVIMCRTVAEKLKAIKTDGLPAELKAGFEEFAKANFKMAAVFDGFPEKPVDILPYLNKRMGEAEFSETFNRKIKEATAELFPVAQRFIQLTRKYGIEPLDASPSVAK